jgi:plastocyanin
MTRTNIRSVLVVSTVIAASLLGIAIAAGKPAARHYTVVITAMRFEPQELTVQVGDSVKWVNHDPFPHTVTAVVKQFESHDIPAGTSWTYVAKSTGGFSYQCSLHPNMPGMLYVK